MRLLFFYEKGDQGTQKQHKHKLATLRINKNKKACRRS